MRYWLVMPAAGSGQRFGSGEPKQYARLQGRSLIEWSLAPFLADDRCAGVAVALAIDDTRFAALRCAADPRVRTVTGGAQRCDSVRLALAALDLEDDAWVMIHDAARPCVSAAEIGSLLELSGPGSTGGLLAVPVSDTLKASDAAGAVVGTASRDGLWRALTPQLFQAGTLRTALDAAVAAGRMPTDESQAVEWLGLVPRIVRGAGHNLKVTQPADLALAEAILRLRRGGEMKLRVGSGFDVHAFGTGGHVMLGGVRVPHSHGVVAHSDGDVLLHALCDALLGAAGLGDIGQHFPDSDPRWRGADSSRFVAAARQMLEERGLAVVNADLTLVCEAPRIGAHRDAICRHIAGLLGTAPAEVNLKATTTEKLGFTGRGEGIAAYATVLLSGGASPAPAQAE